MHHSIFFAPNLPTAIFILRGKSEKYTKENMPVERFGPQFSHNGLINLISWPVCHIFIALSVDTHIGYSHSHKSHMAELWPNDHYVINEGKNALLIYFPLYIFRISPLK